MLRAFFILILVIYFLISIFLPNLSLRQNALFIGIPLVILFFLLLLKKILSGFKLYKFLNPAHLYLIFLSIPTLIGFLNGNNTPYLIGDLWQVIFILLILNVVVELVKDKEDICRLFEFIILLTIIDVLIYFVKITVSGYFRSLSLSSMILVPLLFYYLIYVYRKHKWIYGVFLFLASYHLILTRTRTYWIGAFLGILLIILFFSFKKLSQPKTIAVSSFIILLFVIFQIAILKSNLASNDLDLVRIISSRIKDFKTIEFTGELGSFEGRILEGKEIISEYNNFTIINKLIGKGFGAFYENPRFELAPKEGPFAPSPHFIHITYLDILFYQGVLGLFFFFYFIVSAFFVAYKSNRLKKIINSNIYINKLSIIMILVFLCISLGANYIWFNLYFSIFLAIPFAHYKIVSR